jgi:hypothetical protein
MMIQHATGISWSRSAAGTPPLPNTFCRRHGVKVILTLADTWLDVDSKPSYLKWSVAWCMNQQCIESSSAW